MNHAAWRPVALACIAFAVIFVCYQTALPERENFGIQFVVQRESAGTLRVTAIERGSPADKAGIHVGDRIDYGTTALERARALYATPGATVTVTINGSRRVTVRARPASHTNVPWPELFLRLAFLLVAALLAWRRPADAAARALVAFLFCYGLAIAMANGVLPSPALSIIVLQIGTLVFFLLGTGAAAIFISRFPSGKAKPVPRFLANLAMALAALTALAVAASEWTITSANALSELNFALLIAFVLIGLLVLATLVVAYVRGEPSERQRRRWIFLLLGIGLSAPIIDVIVQTTFGFQPWVDQLTLVPLAMLPLGLAYVILRHRVLDVGFVINRAVVYTLVSVFVVAIFVIVETLLSKYVEHTNHAESIAVQLAVALALGFSIRAIHSRVDRFVDAVLFRERHLAEAAIRFLAHDAPYITDAGILFERCVKTVEQYLHARGTGVWIAEGASYRAAHSTFEREPIVDENDSAVVAMRARRAIVDITDTDSALPGVIAFPMAARGILLGFLVCGPKREDETYAPDERDALSALAAGVGHALDAIEVRSLRARLDLALGGQGL